MLLFKLIGVVLGVEYLNRLQRYIVRILAKNIVLVEGDSIKLYLAYYERYRHLSRCVRPSKVNEAFYKLYDICRHFADRITIKNATHKYY